MCTSMAILNTAVNLIENNARSACLRYAGCKHFVSALGPSALGWGKTYLGFYKLGICFFSYRANVTINSH